MKKLSDISDCQLVKKKVFGDERGLLVPIEFAQDIPYAPQRIFFISNTDPTLNRAAHGHKLCHQSIMASKGNVNVVLHDGIKQKTYSINDPSLILHVPPGIWIELTHFTKDAVVSVFASMPYDRNEYIETWEEFLDFRKSQE